MKPFYLQGMTSMMVSVLPAALVGLRMAIAPVLVWDALDAHISPWFLAVYLTAVVSDILDGVVARRLGVSTANLRRADSWADVGLYLAVAIAAWLTHPEVVVAFRLPLLAVVAVQALWWLVNLAKYGKPASYHTYSAKLWGITLCIATVALFGYGSGGVPLWLCCIVGILHTLEEIVMTLILPEWHHDVLSLVHALRLRQGDRMGQASL